MSTPIVIRPMYHDGIIFNDNTQKQIYDRYIRAQDICLQEIKNLINDIENPSNNYRLDALLEQREGKLRELAAIHKQIDESVRQSPESSRYGAILPFQYTPNETYSFENIIHNAHTGARVVAPNQSANQHIVSADSINPVTPVNASVTTPINPINPVTPINASVTNPVNAINPVIPINPVNVPQLTTQMSGFSIAEHYNVTDYPAASYVPRTAEDKEHALKWLCVKPIRDDPHFAKILEGWLVHLQATYKDIDFHELVKHFYGAYPDVHKETITIIKENK